MRILYHDCNGVHKRHNIKILSTPILIGRQQTECPRGNLKNIARYTPAGRRRSFRCSNYRQVKISLQNYRPMNYVPIITVFFFFVSLLGVSD